MKSGTRAFTLIELLVTIGIAAAVITAAVIGFGAFQRARSSLNLSAIVDIGASNAATFYALDTSRLQTWNAPSFSRRALAEELRDAFWEDVAQSTAVFALAREDHESVRPQTFSIPVPAPQTPEEFRAALVAAVPTADSIFSSETTVLRRANPANSLPVNYSVFLLSPSAPGTAIVRAIYEVDFVAIEAGGGNAESGVYATVRRYVQGSLSAYFDIFYPADEEIETPGALQETRTAAFSPVARYFSAQEAAGWFATAERVQPFYFFWWPDPGIPRLGGEIHAASFAAGDPRADYQNMAARTAFFLAVPQFPSR